MSFGEDIEKEFRNQTCSIINVKEEDLFNALKNTFVVAANSSIKRCSVIHGPKSFVEFDDKEGPVFYEQKDRGKSKVKCELADMLFICSDGNMLRICFLQNKFKRKIHELLDPFSVDLRQLYLLKERPIFRRKKLECTLLNKAICPSIGSYGIFSNTNKNGIFEMIYYSADAIEKLPVFKSSARLKIEEPRRKKFGKFEQMQYAVNIKDFAENLKNMLIGSPFDIEEGLILLGNREIINEFVNMGLISEGRANLLDIDENRKTPYKAIVILDCR